MRRLQECLVIPHGIIPRVRLAERITVLGRGSCQIGTILAHPPQIGAAGVFRQGLTRQPVLIGAQCLEKGRLSWNGHEWGRTTLSGEKRSDKGRLAHVARRMSPATRQLYPFAVSPLFEGICGPIIDGDRNVSGTEFFSNQLADDFPIAARQSYTNTWHVDGRVVKLGKLSDCG